MEPAVARAFLCMQISPEKRANLRACELAIEYRRGPLTPFEVCLQFKITPAPVPEVDLANMQALRKEYEREVLWKRRKIEEKDHQKKCVQHCHCRTVIQELHDWEDWALNRFCAAGEAAA